jgi:nitroreductase
MALMDLIQQRRSVRQYLAKPVEREKIIKCLEAARLAPSAVNMQPWKFIVVDDKDTRERLFKAAFHGIFSFNRWAENVPVFIVVVIARRGLFSNVLGNLGNSLRSLLDIGIATTHFLLQAEELGLGTCWMGGLHEKGVKATLRIPGGNKVAAIIALGYPDEAEIKHQQVRHSLAEISAFNDWGRNNNQSGLSS